MTDVEYMLKTDQREKKSAGRGYQHKVKGSRGRVKFPSDYLTTKEKKKLNGEVATVNLGRPIGWMEFNALPKGLQKEYLSGLVEKYDVPTQHIADMMGIQRTKMVKKMNQLEVYHKGKRPGFHPWDKDGWNAWINESKAILEQNGVPAEKQQDTELTDEMSKVKTESVKKDENSDEISEIVPMISSGNADEMVEDGIDGLKKFISSMREAGIHMKITMEVAV